MLYLISFRRLVIGIFFSHCSLDGVVIEFALDNPKRNKKGELRIKKDSFVIEKLFKDNVWDVNISEKNILKMIVK